MCSPSRTIPFHYGERGYEQNLATPSLCAQNGVCGTLRRGLPGRFDRLRLSGEPGADLSGQWRRRLGGPCQSAVALRVSAGSVRAAGGGAGPSAGPRAQRANGGELGVRGVADSRQGNLPFGYAAGGHGDAEAVSFALSPIGKSVVFHRHTGAIEWSPDREAWEGLTSIGVVESVREIAGEASSERLYYLPSLAALRR